MKKISFFAANILALAILLVITGGLAYADDTGPTEDVASQSLAVGNVQNYIPVQGRLTDASGNPLNGDYTIAFRLYDAYTGGTALCLDTNLVKVANGLFSSEIWGNCQNSIQGQQLYLSMEVENNGEMEPRQPIFAVPYAWGLRPGGVIIGAISGPAAVLHIENSEPTGRGLRAYATSLTGANYGVVGASKSPDGIGVYANNTGGGTGLLAESNTGVAIQAAGTGVIRSSASSYVWISGSGLRPYRQSDDTIIDMDTIGGAKVTRGAAAGTRNVMLPITIPGQLYGQNVTVTGLDVYFLSDTASDGITATLFRRQKGVCSTSPCYATILFDSAFYGCDDAVTPSGCSHHWDLTSNNILTSSSGVLYLTFELAFNSGTSWVDIGGVRLTLEHD
ncbi:MAG: hypothetical protein PHQ40_19245 [Anaerolineaceae bacterium]|nr:hypothetical protein [Anaerolineaceae bacterium]